MKVIATATIENSAGPEYPNVVFELHQKGMSVFIWEIVDNKFEKSPIEESIFTTVDSALEQMYFVYSFEGWNLQIELVD